MELVITIFMIYLDVHLGLLACFFAFLLRCARSCQGKDAKVILLGWGDIMLSTISYYYNYVLRFH